MKPKQSGIRKITRPRLPEVVQRKRLFRIVDQFRTPVIWISGPAGSGKTTLAASWLDARSLACLWYQIDEGDADVASFFYYLGLAARTASPRFRRPLPLLTPEYALGVPTFSRRYFEALFARLPSPAIVVFDNYHEVPESSPFHAVLQNGLAAMPEGSRVIVISRAGPPPALALLGTYGKIGTVEWEDLKFDRIETASLLSAGKKTKPGGKMLTSAQEMTSGWAAGLVLLSERVRSGSGLVRIEQFSPREFFDYFATELFEKIDSDRRLFLLKTAFLPTITPPAAARLTGNDNAHLLLADLSRTHFFTEQRSLSEPVYQYHPLFREFLRSRARETLPSSEVGNVQRQAGGLLEDAGQVDDAAACYIAAGSWDRLAKLITANAASLLAQGRYRNLEQWLKSVPSAVLEKDPWLLYWMGACRMPRGLPESHRCFERALSLFREQDDAAGVFRAWSGAVETLVQEMGDITRLDSWIELVFELMEQYDFPSQEIEDEVTARIFTAMPWVPSEPLFVEWRGRAMALIERNADPNLRLMTAFYLFFHHTWTGDYATSGLVLDVIRRLIGSRKGLSPLAQSMGSMCDGWHAWLAGDVDRSFAIMTDALAHADESGVHIWDKNLLIIGIGARLSASRVHEAGKLLDRMAEGLEQGRLFDRTYYQSLVAWRWYLMNDLPRALPHQKKALELAHRTNFPITVAEAHYGLALTLRSSYRSSALGHSMDLHRIAERMGSDLIRYKSLLLDAVLAFDSGNETGGRDRLRTALALAREKGFVYFKWWIPSLMTELCVKALESGIEADYVRHLIRTCNLVPDEPPLHLDIWPWPVQLYTLGDFRILVDGKPVAFSGKVQKKPLEMLKALIALGGSGIREDQLADALWPDAEGDAASASLRTTLHRLRQLIAHEGAIGVREGRVSLDPRYCWVDAWAFEKTVQDTEELFRNEERKPAGPKPAARGRRYGIRERWEKAMGLYRGHFLSNDRDKPWAVSTRERLRNRFLRAVKAQGDRWLRDALSAGTNEERKIFFGKAAASYDRGLEIDDASEEFYQGLMLCHHRAGAAAEALKVYQRCVSALAAAFGIAPSEETERIAEEVRRGRAMAVRREENKDDGPEHVPAV